MEESSVDEATMDREALAKAYSLTAEGRFFAALDSLNRVHATGTLRIPAEVLRAELLEKTGQSDESLSLLLRLDRSKTLTHGQQAACHFLRARLELDRGDTEEAVVHLQRSASLARQSGTWDTYCNSRFRIALLVADREGPAAASSILAEARSRAFQLGDRHVMAAFHLASGELEARLGAFANAHRHTTLALRLLASQPSLWLETWGENNLLGMAVARLDYGSAQRHSERLSQLVTESGSAHARRTYLANLGNLNYAIGNFEEAVSRLREAISCIPNRGELSNGMLDTLARIQLTQGRLGDCDSLLISIENSIRTQFDRAAYSNRYSTLTRAELLLRQGAHQAALETAETAFNLAERTDDDVLRTSTLITKAEILTRMGRTRDTCEALTQAAQHLSRHSPLLLAHYERAMACALAAGGNTDRGRVHFDRAIRIYNGIRNVPGVIELSTAWRQVGGDESSPREASSAQTSARTEGHPSDLLQDVAALLIHAGRPELIATSAVALLGSTGHIRSAAATAVAADGSTETLASFDDLSKEPPDSTRTIAVGTSRGRSVSLTIALPAGLDACATINAVQLLLDVVHDLERARAERDERLTLWPIDDPADTEGAVVGGRMRDLMAQAQRFARTSAGVLITGESGTGKEILARAIHRYSPRADKPFVPFNCTAVPRDMLESQLFGHRRGAFTGADRDYPGLIRAAKGGTLFLDEVGELSLDLQPKLLRFLESGEIAPLGEPGTLTVDVRIVAATNRNLEQMVQEGRFREDLFYRLNIIPITIPPLRDRRDEIPALVHHFVDQAATEYQKGRLQVAQETMEQLLLHPWPGNIRQLQNEIRRLVVLADPDSVILPTHLTGAASQGHGHAAPPRPATGLELHLPVSGKLTCSVTKLEREMIRHALETTHGRLEDAAASLGISRKGLYLKRRRLGL